MSYLAVAIDASGGMVIMALRLAVSDASHPVVIASVVQTTRIPRNVSVEYATPL